MAFYFPPPPPFTGGAQPYSGNKRLVQSQQNPPPFSSPGRSVAILATIIALAQPDPWIYTQNGPAGGVQPYAPRKLPAAILAVPENPPPFSAQGRSPAVVASTVVQAQADPWVYDYAGQPGGLQPYRGTTLPVAIIRVGADEPPYDQRIAQVRAAIIATTQPDPWQYCNILGPTGGAQAYGQRHVAVDISAVPENPPPVDQRRLSQLATSYTIPQPDPWVYTFQGGHQPYAPTPLDPIFEGLIAPIPGSGKKPGFPSYTPQPADEAKPNKPFRPVWDKPRQGTIEQPKAAPAGPPPLPPAALFGTPGHAGAAKALAPAALQLPSFMQYAPDDPLGLSKRMGEIQDKNDAIAVLKKLGLIRDNNQG